jgi:NAD(P)-dependent dehydrogenase (short-subunit alcohol dehydrogenase family)
MGATVDLGNAADASRWVESVAARLSGVDVLYNNAGSAHRGLGTVESVDSEDWDWIIRNELSLAFFPTRAAWPYLKERGGAIINTASVAGMRGDGIFPAGGHNAAKGGIISLTRQHAVEGGPFGIRANSISPGFIETPQGETRRALKKTRPEGEARRALEKLYPIRRLGRVTDIVPLAAFLASDEASWLTGVNIPVDGGITAGWPSVG